MALKKTFQTEDNFGNPVTLIDAYCRIRQVVGNKEVIHASVEILNSEKNRLLMEQAFSFTPSVDKGSVNFIEQAYKQMKLLPQFEGAEDC